VEVSAYKYLGPETVHVLLLNLGIRLTLFNRAQLVVRHAHELISGNLSPKVVLSRAIAVEVSAYKYLGPETKEEYRTKIRNHSLVHVLLLNLGIRLTLFNRAQLVVRHAHELI
jgi:hypothetical protein